MGNKHGRDEGRHRPIEYCMDLVNPVFCIPIVNRETTTISMEAFALHITRVRRTSSTSLEYGKPDTDFHELC